MKEDADGKEVVVKCKCPKPVRHWARAIGVLSPMVKEVDSFNELKAALTKHTTLTLLSPDRQLFVDFDTSGAGIGVPRDSISCEGGSHIQTRPDL